MAAHEILLRDEINVNSITHFQPYRGCHHTRSKQVNETFLHIETKVTNEIMITLNNTYFQRVQL